MAHEIRRPIAAVDLLIEDADGRSLRGRLAAQWSEDGAYEWELPGREVAFGEDLLAAVDRNLDEELGVARVSARAVCVNSNFALGNHYITVGVVVSVKGEIANRKPTDWTAWEWFAPARIPDRLFPAAGKTLSAYLQGCVSRDFPVAPSAG